MSKFIEITGEQVFGLNYGLGFLLQANIEDIGVELTWDVVTNSNAIKTQVKLLEEFQAKAKKEFSFFDENEKIEKVIPGKQADFNEAMNGIMAKKFKLNLTLLDFEKVKNVKISVEGQSEKVGVTGMTLMQLFPILSK